MTTFTEIGANQINLSKKLEIVGTTGDITECFCCGKQNLKKTVVVKDDEGNYSFFGTSCADHHTKGKYSASRNRNKKVFAPVQGMVDDEIIRFTKIDDINSTIERYNPFKKIWELHHGTNTMLLIMKFARLDEGAEQIKAALEAELAAF